MSDKTTGYSLRSLCEKLGIYSVKTPGEIALLSAPLSYLPLLQPLPSNLTIIHSIQSNLPFIQLFTTNKEQLEEIFPKLKAALLPSGILWVSWLKQSSSLPTDLNENIIRDIGLRNGLVDVKVIAIDKDWSGLKFVYRLKDR